MNFEQYKAQRAALMDELKSLITDGELEEADAKKAEVEDLDDKWDKISIAMANAAALEDKVAKLPDFKAAQANIATNAKPIECMNDNDGMTDLTTLNPAEAYKAPEYVDAWAKTVMGRRLTDYESQLYRMVDDYTHTTGNTGVVIPENVGNRIWEEAADLYPYFGDVTKTFVQGNVGIIQSSTSTEAKWYAETTKTEQGTETLTKLTLTGCDLARTIVVSWQLREMAIPDFIDFIVRNAAVEMGKALDYGVTYGGGSAAEGGPEPTGVITYLKDKGTSQIVTYSDLGYKNIAEARGKIKSGYAAGLAIYANSSTVWNNLASILDGNGRPIFIPDPTGSGVFRIFGMPVKEDAAMADGDILISNAALGYQANVAKQVSVLTQDDIEARVTKYAAYALCDGVPLTIYAHALLTAGAASGSTDTESAQG